MIFDYKFPSGEIVPLKLMVDHRERATRVILKHAGTVQDDRIELPLVGTDVRVVSELTGTVLSILSETSYQEFNKTPAIGMLSTKEDERND